MSESVVAAAIRWGDLVCFTEQPGRHHDVFRALEAAEFSRTQSGCVRPIEQEQGFVTSTGRFIGREEARKLAEANGQLIPSEKDSEGVPFVRQHSQLFSEDVW